MFNVLLFEKPESMLLIVRLRYQMIRLYLPDQPGNTLVMEDGFGVLQVLGEEGVAGPQGVEEFGHGDGCRAFDLDQVHSLVADEFKVGADGDGI